MFPSFSSWLSLSQICFTSQAHWPFPWTSGIEPQTMRNNRRLVPQNSLLPRWKDAFIFKVYIKRLGSKGNLQLVANWSVCPRGNACWEALFDEAEENIHCCWDFHLRQPALIISSSKKQRHPNRSASHLYLVHAEPTNAGHPLPAFLLKTQSLAEPYIWGTTNNCWDQLLL